MIMTNQHLSLNLTIAADILPRGYQPHITIVISNIVSKLLVNMGEQRKLMMNHCIMVVDREMYLPGAQVTLVLEGLTNKIGG